MEYKIGHSIDRHLLYSSHLLGGWCVIGSLGGGMGGRADGWMGGRVRANGTTLSSRALQVLFQIAVRSSLLRQMYDDVLYIGGR